MTALVFYPVTKNYFYSDDFLHFWQIVNDSAGRFLLRMHGDHMYLTRNLVTLLLYKLVGMRAAPYFWLSFLTHLVNVGLLYWLACRLTDSWRIACVTAALWGMAPVNEGAIGWFASYGHVLAGTCTLVVLIGVAGCRARRPLRPAKLWCWAVVTILGATCFGVGIAVALVLPIIAWLWVPLGRQRMVIALVFATTAVVIIAVYYTQSWMYGRIFAEPPPGGSISGVKDYWFLCLTSTVNLFGYGLVRLLLGALYRAADYPGARGYTVIALALLAATIAVIRTRGQILRPVLACGLVAIASYGLISMGRAPLEPMMGPRGLAASLRYHYIAGMMVALCVGAVLRGILPGKHLPPWLSNAAVGIWAAIALAIALRWGTPIFHYDFARRETLYALNGISTLASAAPPGGDVFVANRPFRSIGFFMTMLPDQFPGWAAIFAMFHPDDMLDGHRVYFLVPEAQLAQIEELGGRQVAALLRPETVQ
ncbi:MAG: hypothetical protein ACRD3Q_15015 [Terriglobales bacterium]